MAKDKKKKSPGTKQRNDDRKCGKASKKRPGVSAGAHNGHSVGGYSINKHGAAQAALLAEGTRPRAARRAVRRGKKSGRTAVTA